MHAPRAGACTRRRARCLWRHSLCLWMVGWGSGVYTPHRRSPPPHRRSPGVFCQQCIGMAQFSYFHDGIHIVAHHGAILVCYFHRAICLRILSSSGTFLLSCIVRVLFSPVFSIFWFMDDGHFFSTVTTNELDPPEVGNRRLGEILRGWTGTVPPGWVSFRLATHRLMMTHGLESKILRGCERHMRGL